MKIVYGSTETSSMVTMLNDNEILERVNSVGKPVGSNAIIIKDKNNVELEANKIGKVCVKSKSIMKGYLNDSNIQICIPL